MDTLTVIGTIVVTDELTGLVTNEPAYLVDDALLTALELMMEEENDTE